MGTEQFWVFSFASNIHKIEFLTQLSLNIGLVVNILLIPGFKE